MTMSPDRSRRYVITAAPPNPNGDLHLGHLSGPFLGADVLRRFLRQQGHEAIYVSYSDDYSCYVRRRAAQLGCSTKRTAYTYGRRMEETLALAQLSPDCFTHPQSRPLHTELVQRFFLELWNAGALVVKDMPAFFCTGCRQHLYEAEVSGLCPHCGEQSGGLECEQCARRLDTTGLREPRCTGCGAPPQVVALPRIVLSLERVRQGLADFVAAGHRRPRLAEFLAAALQRPLPDVPFTRLDPLGIPVPLPGWEGHVLDTWFGGIWGYFAAAGTWAEAAGEPVTAVVVDGCGAPQHALSVTGLARGVLSLVEAPEGSRDRSVADAMRADPWFVAGTGREDTDLMTAVPGLLVKGGADGVHVAALPGRGAVALKLDDGGDRGRTPALAAGLLRLGVADAMLAQWLQTPVSGGDGVVGEVRPSALLRD